MMDEHAGNALCAQFVSHFGFGVAPENEGGSDAYGEIPHIMLLACMTVSVMMAFSSAMSGATYAGFLLSNAISSPSPYVTAMQEMPLVRAASMSLKVSPT